MTLDNQQQKEKLQKLATHLEKSAISPNLPISDALESIDSTLKELVNKEVAEPKGVQKVEIQGAEIITIKGEKGDKGDVGEKGDTGEQGIQGEKGLDGKDGQNGKDGLNGQDGEDGDDADPTEVTKQVIEALTPLIPKSETAEELAEKLNLQEVLDKISELEKSFTKQINSIPRGGGGGASAIGVAQAFKYIAHTEQPGGLIDGANKTYTVKNNIWWIAGFTLNGEQIAELPNFTFSGHTITFSVALPAVYSGNDFEIKYIGT